MPSSITSRRRSGTSTLEPVSSSSSPSSRSEEGLTVGERLKRRRAGRKAATLKRKANRATSSSSSSAKAEGTGNNNDLSSNDNAPSTPSRRTTPPNVYEDSDGGVESEADNDMATTPMNLGKKRRFSNSTVARSPSPGPSPSPAPAKNKKPHKSTKSAVAEKRKVVDSDDESDKENSRPSKKQKGVSTPNTNDSDLEYSPNEVDLDTDTGTLTPKKRKGTNKGNDSESESDFAPSPKKPARKTGTKAQQKKKPVPKKDNKRTKNTSALEKAASPEKVYKKFIPKTPPPKTAKQLEVIKKQAEKRAAYLQLPAEYRNTLWLAAEVDRFCLEKGIGHFDEMEREQQLRLLKEVRMYHQYMCLLDLQKSAVRAKNRQSNSWEKTVAQGLKSTSGGFDHDRRMNLRQRELDDATRNVDAWEGKAGHITYVVAYNAKYPPRAKKYGINNSHGPAMMARRAQFFAGLLPVEAWEKRASDDAAVSSDSAESSDSSGVQTLEDRLNAAQSGKNKSSAPAAGAAAASASVAGPSAAEVDTRSRFDRIDPTTAMKLCPFIFKGIHRVEIGEKESDDSEGVSDKPELTMKAFDVNDKPIDTDETDVEFARACSVYVLRSLESLVGAPMGSLNDSYLAILTGVKTNALLERVKRKIGEIYDLNKEMQSSDWLSVAINEFEPLELPMELLKAMTALSAMGEAPVV